MQTWSLQEDYLRYKGVWDHEKVYRTMHDWLVARGYRMMESLYKDKPPETEIEWIAKKKVDE